MTPNPSLKLIRAVLKALWKDPVWAAVISAGIVAAAGAVGTYVFGLWPSISSLASSLWRVANEQSNWSKGQVWIAIAMAIPSVLLALAMLWTMMRPSKSPRDWRDLYTEDQFVGLRWRWEYYSDGALRDIHSFCPHCDFQVFPHRASAYTAIDRIGFHCDSCGRDLTTFEESQRQLESRVQRLIQQKIRTGLWRNTI